MSEQVISEKFHARKQIRDKIKEKLLNVSVLNEKNISYDNPENLEEYNYPSCFVNTLNENLQYVTVGSKHRMQERTLNIAIIAFVKSKKSDLLQDKLDSLTFEIENVFSETRKDTKLDDLVISMNLRSSDFEFSEYELNAGCVMLNYDIIYRTFENETNKIIN